MIHEFHFMINEKFYLKPLKFSKELDKSLSGAILIIVEKMNIFIDRDHLMAKEKESKYELISDLKEKRFHIHCYFPEYLYRKMKLLHQDLNTYSLGQIIRKIINSFISGCIKYGAQWFIKKLDNINENWNKKKNIYKNEKRKFTRHMSHNSRSLFYCLTIYDNNYTPYLMQLIE